MRTLVALLLSGLLSAGCCFTQKCRAQKDARWMRSTCRPIPTKADEEECIQGVEKYCVRHDLPQTCGEATP
jgi:hypothetical protein